MITPVDATTTDAWADLHTLKDALVPDLRGWFAADPHRAEEFTFDLADLRVDLSKNLINDDVVAALLRLAEQVNLAERRDAMFNGERINVTEDRSLLPHFTPPDAAGWSLTARTSSPTCTTCSTACMPSPTRSARVNGSGNAAAHQGGSIGIDIGGSDLGPVMVYEALLPYKQDGLSCRFVSNIDPNDCAEKVGDLDPETTLFIVASKTFTTLETLTNARMARDWLLAKLVEQGAIDDTESARLAAVGKHFVAVSTALDKVAEFGIDPANAFGFWDWVGGRYSVDSAVGLPVAIAIGPDGFRDFLGGFHAVDEHFAVAPRRRSNVPVLMGLLNVWYVNFFKSCSHAVLPYAQQLSRFAAYLQQLTMESNGKSVRWDGTPVTSDTGEIFWGEPGTNGQHAFYQLIHQGTRLIPADFIAVANPAHPVKDGDTDVHGLFLANFFAQTAALAFGKTEDEVRAEGTAEEIVPARVFSGNKPTTSIMAAALTPSVVGQLIALYEHITFVQGIVWGIDSFDQWGVELGKKLALEIAPAVFGDAEALSKQDPSTQSLVSWYLANRA